MKILPFEYWKTDYKDTEVPTPLQRYWVHRCLEMLDPDTSYLHCLGIVNLHDLLDDFVNIPLKIKNKPNYRTFFFLLSEITFRLENEGCLLERLFAQTNIEITISEFERAICKGQEIGSRTYNANGTKKSALDDFAHWLSDKNKQNNGDEFTRMQLIPVIKHLFSETKRWLNAHEEMLFDFLDQPIDGHSLYRLDAVTESWLIELTGRYNYTPVHLSNTLRGVFLEQSSQPFLYRLLSLFQQLNTESHAYIVFLRLQARQELLSVGQIGSVQFLAQSDEGIRVSEDNHQRNILSDEDLDAIRYFFFEGKISNRLLFARIPVESTNLDSAAYMALQQLEQGLVQARFEFERSSFSIDNTLYILDNNSRTIQKFTRRQADAQAYFSLGNSSRFGHMLRRLEYLRSSTTHSTHDLIEHVISLALSWHRHAIESQSMEIKFMSHWIELEQLFKTMRSHRIIEGEGSEGDILVRVVAKALTELEQDEMLRNLWGDLSRCGVFPPKPYLSHVSGYAWYTPAYENRKRQEQKQDLVSYRRWRSQKPDLNIKNIEHRTLKHYRLPMGFVLFCLDEEQIFAQETWLAGPKLNDNWRFPNLRELFHEQTPNLESILYLVRHWWETIKPLLPEESRIHHESIYHLKRSQVLAYEEAMRFLKSLPSEVFELILDHHYCYDCRGLSWLGYLEEIIAVLHELGFDESSELVNRAKNMTAVASRLKPYLSDLEHLEKIGDILTGNPNTPDGVLLELFRNRTPKLDELESLLKEHHGTILGLLPDQPLLQMRVKAIATQLIEKSSNKLERERYYVWQLDLMRQTRNEMAHNAVTPNNINALSRQLYQFSKRYITHIIYAIPPLWRILMDNELTHILKGERVYPKLRKEIY